MGAIKLLRWSIVRRKKDSARSKIGRLHVVNTILIACSKYAFSINIVLTIMIVLPDEYLSSGFFLYMFWSSGLWQNLAYFSGGKINLAQSYRDRR